MITENEWIRKYKRGLLEREPGLRGRRLEVAYELMTHGQGEMERWSPERQVLSRALEILVTR